jgi:NTP pyrophosphatase (non-canonical NTP hydrolase)
MTTTDPVLDALRTLVSLHDGPKDSPYYARKEAAWEAARDALHAREYHYSTLGDMQRTALTLSKRWFADMHEGPGHEERVAILYALGMAGESGEAVDVIKKGYRKGDVFAHTDRQKLADELSDAFTYILDACEIFSIDLESSWNHKMAANEERWTTGDWGYHAPPGPGTLDDTD